MADIGHKDKAKDFSNANNFSNFLRTDLLTMSFFPSNLKMLRKRAHLTQEQLAEEMGITRPQVGSYEEGRADPPIPLLIKFANRFKVPIEDLYQLSLLKWDHESVPKSVPKSVPNGQKLTKTADPAAVYGHTVVTVDEGGTDNIVMVDVKAAAGYPQKLTEPTFFKPLPAIKIPVFRNGTFRMFQVDGNSMNDTLKHNDWLVTEFLSDGFSGIKEGYIHVIVTHTRVVVKRLLNRVAERGKIVCLSDNEDEDTFEINAEDVLELWRVRMKWSVDLSSSKQELQRIVRNLQADMVAMQDRMNKVEAKKYSKGT